MLYLFKNINNKINKMENFHLQDSIEAEFECQICMDLLTEPITTLCGHTFCKICLIRYLKTKLNCPMCRKPILQSNDNMAKNVILENIIKFKYNKKYNERMKAVKLYYDEEVSSSDHIRNNLPIIFIKDCYVWPMMKKKLTINDMQLEPTITISSIHDRLLLIVPNEINQINSNSNNICSLVEINSIDKSDLRIIIEVMGIKRFRYHSFSEAHSDNLSHPFYIATGEILKDINIDSQDLLNLIKNKLNQVVEINNQILSNSPYSIVSTLEKNYGKAPQVGNILSTTNLEPVSLYYLNIINNNDKKNYYCTNNLIQRVDWLYEKYVEASRHLGNYSLPLNFYDIKSSGNSHNQLKFTLILFFCIIIFGLGVKYKFLRL